MLLEAWRAFEKNAKARDAQKVAAVQAVERRMPKRIKRKRPIETDEGLDAGMKVRLCCESPFKNNTGNEKHTVLHSQKVLEPWSPFTGRGVQARFKPHEL